MRLPPDVERLPDCPCPVCGTIGPAPVMYRDPPCCDFIRGVSWIYGAADHVEMHGGDRSAFMAEVIRILDDPDGLTPDPTPARLTRPDPKGPPL